MNKFFKLTRWLLALAFLSVELMSCEVVEKTPTGTVTNILQPLPIIPDDPLQPLEPTVSNPNAGVAQSFYDELSGYWSEDPGTSLPMIQFEPDKTFTIYLCNGDKFVPDPLFGNEKMPYKITNNRVIEMTYNPNPPNPNPPSFVIYATPGYTWLSKDTIESTDSSKTTYQRVTTAQVANAQQNGC